MTAHSEESVAVGRTAVDALTAKASAVMASSSSSGDSSNVYQPIPQNDHVYRHFLRSMVTTPEKKSDSVADSDPSPQQSVTPPSILLRPQSPLVRAGYAMRVASVAQTVHSFVKFHTHNHESSSHTTTPITLNLVILGCGMDVLGLWAQSLGEIDSVRIQVWEVDTLSVARRKRETLLRQGLVTPITMGNNTEEHGIVLEGCIINPTTKGETQANGSLAETNYHLLAADLRDLASLEATLGQAIKQQAVSTHAKGYPTLVLLELVLAYLGDSHTENLLEWCASNLLGDTSSGALAAFESLGGDTSQGTHTEAPRSTIVQAYQQEYIRQFQAKLHRGKSPHSTATVQTTKNESTGGFYPLGATYQYVEQRIARLSGYNHNTVHACLAGTAAYWARKQQSPSPVRLTLPPGELFDEHAALSLHLASYCLVLAFPVVPTGASVDDAYTQFQLQQQLCPWLYPKSRLRQVSAVQRTYVTSIDPGEENEVRDLFEATYADLGNTYPTVKKMVKNALKKEFVPPPTGTGISNVGTDIVREGESTIRLGYQRQGGDFLVAVSYAPHGGSEKENASCKRTVLGGIGVRKWHSHATKPTQEQLPLPTYEMHRFFVAKEHRGKGLGKALLQMAEAVVAANMRSRRGSQPYRIVATTLVVLEEANGVYSKQGYYLLEESAIGDLGMKTYAKDFP